MLAARGRIALDRDPVTWLEEALEAAAAELVPLTPTIAAASAVLRDFRGDPADRLIVATALTQGATLVTRDERIRTHAAVETVW
jgi:PIN domain nuclease of toxin-antitoxin system